MLDEGNLARVAETHGIEGFDTSASGELIYAAYRDGGYALFRDGDRLTQDERDLTSPTWLNARDTVLALADEGGTRLFDFVEVDPETGETTFQLDDDAMNINPIQSPVDQHAIAFVSTRGGGFDLFQLDLESGTVESLVAPDRPVMGFDWAPDGERLVYQVGQAHETELRVADTSGGEEESVVAFDGAESIFPTPYTFPGPRLWGPRGILFAANVENHYDIGVARSDGTYEWLVRSDRDTVPAGWAPDGERFAFLEMEAGHTQARVWEDGQTHAVAAHGVNSPVRWLPAGDLAYLKQAHDSAGDLWVDDRLVVEEGRLEAELVSPESVTYQADDGTSIPALLYEADGDAAIIYAQGGNGHNRRDLAWKHQYLVSRGYTVLAPDYRGASWQGREHKMAGYDDIGASVGDLAAGGTYLRQQGYDAVGGYGFSRGGYLTYLAAGKTDAFDAVAGISGFVNLRTRYENTSGWTQQLMERRFGGGPDERPDAYARWSPVTHVDDISIPVMVIHGANDTIAPLDEAEQLLASLRERGLSHESIVYEDEGHGIAATANRIEMMKQVVDFFDSHLVDSD